MTFNSEVRSGVALGVIYFFWLLMEYYIGFHTKYLDYLPFVFWLYSIIPAIGINWAMKAKRDRYYSGKINFFQAFKTGFVISIIMSLVSALMKFIYVFLINPLYFDTRIGHDKLMIEDLELAQPDREKMISKVLSDNTLSYSMFETVVFMLIIGILITILAAFLVKKNTRKRPQTSDTQSETPPIQEG
jgi:uncharacterized membrane protein YvlD (DUF360 family)